MTINEKFYREFRCYHCHKLFGYEYVFAGRIAIYCPRCGELTELTFKHTETQENKDIVQKQFTLHNENQKGG